MNVNFGRAALAGVIGAVAMSGVALMGIPPMNPADMLAGLSGGSTLMVTCPQVRYHFLC